MFFNPNPTLFLQSHMLMLHYYNFILAPSRLKTGKNQKYILIVGTPGHISATIKQSIKKKWPPQ
jgi:hypothetical protein